MKLISVEVTEFQSIRRSNPFEIGDITCLVGKNESGKTAILQAIYRLNPIIDSEGTFDVTDDYPRADVEDYQYEIEKQQNEHAIVTRVVFSLEKSEIDSIEAGFGKGILEKPKLTLSKGYSNTLLVGLQIEEKIAIKALLKQAKLPPKLASDLGKSQSYREFAESIENYDDSENQEHIKRLQKILPNINDSKSLTIYIYDTYLEESVPKFLYFDEYYQMRGHENIESLKARIEQNELLKSDYPLLGLIELARIDLEQLVDPSRTEWLINKLEGAGNHLSKKVLKYWSQNNHLQMKFDVRPARPGDPSGMTNGTNLWTRVYDSKHFVTTPLGTRSRGFIWFFSFLAWFDQQQRKSEPLILLLDEPGLFLHGKAQNDLLIYMEKELKGNHQVIYTTHSPFMVDPHRFERVRIVQDKSMDTDDILPDDQQGTKVLNDITQASDDSLFPLQGALGYEIHQTLFVGPNSLVVEGVSDLFYIQSISAILEEQGRQGLSLKWTITPVGGASKVPTFVALLGAQKGMKLATLIDIQKKDTQMIENLYKRKLLKKKNVLTFGESLNKDEADIEDMFSEGFYLKLVNAEYASEMNGQISTTKLTSRSPRILIRLERYFQSNPLKNGRQFSHYRPARYFTENITGLKADISAETLVRFEAIFKELNKLL